MQVIHQFQQGPHLGFHEALPECFPGLGAAVAKAVVDQGVDLERPGDSHGQGAPGADGPQAVVEQDHGGQAGIEAGPPLVMETVGAGLEFGHGGKEPIDFCQRYLKLLLLNYQ